MQRIVLRAAAEARLNAVQARDRQAWLLIGRREPALEARRPE